MEELLTQAGLSELQATTYLLLLERGEMTPPAVAQTLTLSRSNAYKLLDGLVELELASRRDKGKKFVYKAEDPLALNNILSQERNRVIALENAVKLATQTLRAKYQHRQEKLQAKVYHGPTKLKNLYEQQALTGDPIHFIRSRADIPTLGYETMTYVRELAIASKAVRFGITQDAPEAPYDAAIDARTNLKRTWIAENEYTAPVEISISGDEVILFVFEKAGSAVHIQNQAVAEAFTQIWKMLDNHIRQSPNYAQFPKKAQRQV